MLTLKNIAQVCDATDDAMKYKCRLQKTILLPHRLWYSA